MIARVAWLLARPGSSGAATLVLPITAFAIVTALLLTVIGGAQSFWRWTDDSAVGYQLLAVIALVLLVVPLASLGGAAARLSARRRDDRLATLRLLGATPATVSALAVIESAMLALVGSVIGIAGYFAIMPGIALVPFRGEPLGIGGVLLPPAVLLAVPLGIVVLAVVSAVLGLRQVVISPLGVRTRQDAPKLSWLRIVIGAAVILVAFGLMSGLQLAGEASVLFLFLGAAFGGTLAVLNLIGPWVIRLVAQGQARRATKPAKLLAARSVLESPKAAWRQVSGVAMTSFMAVFAGVGIALMDAMGGSGEMDREGLELITDIRTGILITVVGSFLMVACSVGVNQAAGILDRRELYRSLDMLGMPEPTMDAARRRAVMSPLRITAVGSAVVAAVVMLPLTGITLIVQPLALLVIAGVLAAGIGVVALGLVSTRPMLRRAAESG
ncbi:permease [Agromyces mediolanus]|uniref:FtsX-like permease family protein n=1 Tax=Agromyces mediolanus TaxID=41986 RepID=UPI00203E0B0E|nr:FtsX-like permease family protein [Agromyces mediolanus]MCM3657375.1 permease [Agromyces mediolanus]